MSALWRQPERSRSQAQSSISRPSASALTRCRPLQPTCWFVSSRKSIPLSQKDVRCILHSHARLPPRAGRDVVDDEQMIFHDQHFLFADPSHQRCMRHVCHLPRSFFHALHLHRRHFRQRLANALRLFGIGLALLRQLNRLVRLRASKQSSSPRSPRSGDSRAFDV